MKTLKYIIGILMFAFVSCSEEEFVLLPGMSLASAKAAVENREENGAYLSLDDFVQRNRIKPHFMLQMEPIIVIGDMPEKKDKPSNSKGRTLDL